MSLASWKKEFYPVPAEKVTKKDAIAHSLRKWRGLTKENKRKHGVEFNHPYLACFLTGPRGAGGLFIDGESCALCVHYFDDDGCVECPLQQALGHTCDLEGAPYARGIGQDGDARPMIRALEKATKLQAKKAAKS